MFRIVSEPIELGALEGAVSGAGGVVRFVGIVRNRADDGTAVVGLSYEAFEPMAAREFAAIADEVRERFGSVALSIIHRIGDVPAGEVSIAVVAAAAHRAAAFDACRYAVDEVKRRAPIWKKERYADDTAAWRPNRGA